MKKRGVQMSRRRKKAGEKARTMAGSAEAEKTAAGSTPAEQEAGSTSAKETLSASIEPAERPENEAEVWQTGARVRIADMEPDYSDITVKNPRIGKVMRLEEEVQRQSEIEKLRSRRIRQEQEYIDRMSLSVENSSAQYQGRAAVQRAVRGAHPHGSVPDARDQ